MLDQEALASEFGPGIAEAVKLDVQNLGLTHLKRRLRDEPSLFNSMAQRAQSIPKLCLLGAREIAEADEHVNGH
jgi:hypothetical protein